MQLLAQSTQTSMKSSETAPAPLAKSLFFLRWKTPHAAAPATTTQPPNTRTLLELVLSEFEEELLLDDVELSLLSEVEFVVDEVLSELVVSVASV